MNTIIATIEQKVREFEMAINSNNEEIYNRVKQIEHMRKQKEVLQLELHSLKNPPVSVSPIPLAQAGCAINEDTCTSIKFPY